MYKLSGVSAILMVFPVGSLELNLQCVPKPVKTSRKCALTQLPEFNPNAKCVSLFDQKKLNGFWPVYQMVEGNPQLKVCYSLVIH